MDIETIRKIVSYNPDTGALTWKRAWPELFDCSEARPQSYRCNIWNSANHGRQAFHTDNGKGYLSGKFLNRTYKAHRIAWAIYYGEWPNNEIDHINHNRSDNRIVNLREASRCVNQQNTSRNSNNTSGVTGVSWCNRDASWVVQTQINGKRTRKNFKTIEAATEFRRSQQADLGFHQNHGLLLSEIR